jgi:hypothetical protein
VDGYLQYLIRIQSVVIPSASSRRDLGRAAKNAGIDALADWATNCSHKYAGGEEGRGTLFFWEKDGRVVGARKVIFFPNICFGIYLQLLLELLLVL